MPTTTIPQAVELALRHYRAGQLHEAEIVCRQILQAEPRQPEALRYLGLIAQAVGQSGEGLQLIDQALSIRPHDAELINDRGNVLLALGRAEEASAAFRRALELLPANPFLLNNLGNALQAQGLPEKALEAYRTALAIQPAFAEAHHNAGNILHERGEYLEALTAYRTALGLRPNYASAYRNLANSLRALRRTGEALEALQAAERLEPANAATENSRGALYLELGRPDEAMASFRRALAWQPGYAAAQSNLAATLADHGELEAALALWRTALAEHPEHAGLHRNFVYLQWFRPDGDAASILRAARSWNDRHAEPLEAAPRAHGNSPAPERRLRLGYVSPNFCDHVVGRNLLPLLREHDRGRFEIFCYSDVARPDAITGLFRGYAQHWRDTAGLSDAQLAERVREDRIDVLVDTTLHMEGCRLLVFARRPAPVQVTFAGYPGTTGLAAMDERLTDPFLDPPGLTDADYSETSLRLPASFWCYDPLERDISAGPLPAAARGVVTFGCFNHSRKLNDAVLALWARVLVAVPGSRLLIQARAANHRQRLLGILRQGGVDSERVGFLDLRPRREYLGLYRRIDIMLDSFPYNGHTTSLDALWMGVPVVTKAGRSVVSRAGLSQLTNLGFPEWVAETDERFIAIAASLASDLPRLMSLRSALRARMEQSPLMNAPEFARGVEAACREAWKQWCARGAPRPTPTQGGAA
jgi:predicted O-linked N-acetylglucosamine transferase (SPINDLY family)